MRGAAAVWRRLTAGISLAGRLTVAMLVVGALAMAGLYYEFSRANRVEIERLQTVALRNSARDLAQSLDDLIRSEMGQVTNLALSQAAQEFIAAPPERRAPLFTPTLADFDNFLTSNRPFYMAVLLLDLDGEVLLSTDGSYTGVRFPASAVLQAAARGESSMSDPGISPLDRRPVVWLSAPVRAAGAAPDAAPDGVLAVALSPEELWQAVERVRIGQGGYALLLDGYGIRLAHGRDRNYVFRSLAPIPPAEWARLQAEGRFADMPRLEDTGSEALLDFIRAEPPGELLVAPPGPGAAPVYYSVAPLESRDWTVVTMLSAREALAPAADVTLRGMGVTLLVVVLLGLTVAWAAQNLVRPVPRLAAAAGRIADGDLSVPVAVEGSSEVRALAANFEQMRSHLSRARDELAAWATTLEGRVASRSQELAALAEVVGASSRGRAPASLLRVALDRALPVVDAEMGGIWLGEPDGGLCMAVWSGFDRELEEALSAFAPGEGLLGQVHQRGEPTALADISQSPRLSRAVVREQRLHAFAAVPLLVSGRSLGVLGVFSHVEGGFSPEAVAVVASIGQQIALALENIALLGQVEAQARSVAALQERERLAGEIHDGVAQNLSYLYVQLDRLATDSGPPEECRAELVRLQRVLEATTGEVRQLIARLQDAPPAPCSLADRLGEEVRGLGAELGLAANVVVRPGADLAVPAPAAAEISRIVGEALRNAAKHGRAARATVELERRNGHALLRVCDDGAGFDPAVLPGDGRRHFGLKVMEARARRLDGELMVSSAPGAGACVELKWPAEMEPPAAAAGFSLQPSSLSLQPSALSLPKEVDRG